MDFMRPFSCNCQNNPPVKPCAKMPEYANTGCNKYEPYDEFQDMPLAMCYVPWQTWKNVYDASNGLKKGTIFGDLVFPFLCANPSCREDCCNTERRCDLR